MPFCESCSKYWTPSAMRPGGSCPTCGRLLDVASTTTGLPGRSSDKIDIRRLAAGDGDDPVSAPWHFKLLVTGLVLYLGWRVVDLFL